MLLYMICTFSHALSNTLNQFQVLYRCMQCKFHCEAVPDGLVARSHLACNSDANQEKIDASAKFKEVALPAINAALAHEAHVVHKTVKTHVPARHLAPPLLQVAQTSRVLIRLERSTLFVRCLSCISQVLLLGFGHREVTSWTLASLQSICWPGV